MKRNLVTVTILASLLMFTACGSSKSSSNSTKPSSNSSTSSSTSSSSAKPAAPSVDVAKYSLEVMDVEREWAKAYVAKDGGFYNSHLAADYLGLEDDGTTTNKDQELTKLNSTMEYEYLNPEDMQVGIYGNTAVILGREQFRGTDNGVAVSGQYRFLDIYVKKGDTWQVISGGNSKQFGLSDGLPALPTLYEVPGDALDSVSADSAKNDLTQLEQEVTTAAIKNDSEKSNQLYGAEYMCLSGDGSVSNKDQVIENYKTYGDNYEYINPSNMNVRVYGSVAVVNGACTIKARGGSVSKYQFIDVWVKRGGAWQMVASHNTVPVTA